MSETSAPTYSPEEQKAIDAGMHPDYQQRKPYQWGLKLRHFLRQDVPVTTPESPVAAQPKSTEAVSPLARNTEFIDAPDVAEPTAPAALSQPAENQAGSAAPVATEQVPSAPADQPASEPKPDLRNDAQFTDIANAMDQLLNNAQQKPEVGAAGATSAVATELQVPGAAPVSGAVENPKSPASHIVSEPTTPVEPTESTPKAVEVEDAIKAVLSQVDQAQAEIAQAGDTGAAEKKEDPEVAQLQAQLQAAKAEAAALRTQLQNEHKFKKPSPSTLKEIFAQKAEAQQARIKKRSSFLLKLKQVFDRVAEVKNKAEVIAVAGLQSLPEAAKIGVEVAKYSAVKGPAEALWFVQDLAFGVVSQTEEALAQQLDLGQQKILQQENPTLLQEVWLSVSQRIKRRMAGAALANADRAQKLRSIADKLVPMSAARFSIVDATTEGINAQSPSIIRNVEDSLLTTNTEITQAIADLDLESVLAALESAEKGKNSAVVTMIAQELYTHQELVHAKFMAEERKKLAAFDERITRLRKKLAAGQDVQTKLDTLLAERQTYVQQELAPKVAAVDAQSGLLTIEAFRTTLNKVKVKMAPNSGSN